MMVQKLRQYVRHPWLVMMSLGTVLMIATIAFASFRGDLLRLGAIAYDGDDDLYVYANLHVQGTIDAEGDGTDQPYAWEFSAADILQYNDVYTSLVKTTYGCLTNSPLGSTTGYSTAVLGLSLPYRIGGLTVVLDSISFMTDDIDAGNTISVQLRPYGGAAVATKKSVTDNFEVLSSDYTMTSAPLMLFVNFRCTDSQPDALVYGVQVQAHLSD